MFKISKQLRDSLLAYMAERPYKEVEAGISALASLEEIKEDTKENIKK